jgi:FAD dependent oxidoreductase
MSLSPHRHHMQVAVIGASLGGVLAAWRAAQAGCHVWLVAEHAWLGGQMTAQAVPPDEHRLIEQGGASQSYLRFREDMRALYRAMPGFLDQAHFTGGPNLGTNPCTNPGTNPGDGWVSRLCFEPVHAARWFETLLAPQVAAGRLHILRLSTPIAAERVGARIHEVVVRCAHTQTHGEVHHWHLIADVFVDATDSGELLALAQLPYRLGKEARAEFDEPDAPAVANRLDQQPVTHVMALRWHATPGALVVAPASYGFWRQHRLAHHNHLLFSNALPGRLPGQSAHLPFTGGAHPQDDSLDWWRYRRIVSREQWSGARANERDDVSLINWAQNDFALHPLLDGPVPQAQVQAAARDLSLCWLHWLQTEAPRDDGRPGCGFPEWQLAPDMLGTPDGLAQQVYVRESRRIMGRHTVHQGHLLAPPESGAGSAGNANSVGIGWYALDIHPTCVSGHGTNAKVFPFELPLGAFIPVDVDNLVPACKNLSVTHLVNACARVHPVEWLAGEVAGLLAAHLVADRAWPDSAAQVAQFQKRLHAAGVPTAWPAALLQAASLATRSH